MLGGMIILLSIVAVSGTMVIPMSENGKANAQAQDHSPVFNGEDIGRIDFIHYAKPDGIGKPPSAVKPPKVDTCYDLMGIRWKSLPVNYIVNPSNTQSLPQGFITDAISASALTWDDSTSSGLFAAGTTGDVRYRVFDGMNAITFGDDDPGIIAVTSVWYSRRTKEILEFDIRFNEYYTWGEATLSADDPDCMDLQNIATHELGHAVGLGDVYNPDCSAVTMYGYSDYEDIEKRDLELPDITGLQSIYGA
ncbi:MAG: matrixin family metalloprotease [Methanomicrobiales archaeon]|nr:matrixin family metalloprotease [Methanomicrobiales archaeon]